MGRLRMRRRHWRQASDVNIGGGWVKPRRSAHASSSERELIPPLVQKAGADIAVHAVADPYPSPAARTAGYHDFVAAVHRREDFGIAARMLADIDGRSRHSHPLIRDVLHEGMLRQNGGVERCRLSDPERRDRCTPYNYCH